MAIVTAARLVISMVPLPFPSLRCAVSFLTTELIKISHTTTIRPPSRMKRIPQLCDHSHLFEFGSLTVETACIKRGQPFLSLSPDRELVIVTQYRSQSRIPLDTFRNMEGIEPRSKEEKEVVEEKGLFRNSWR